MRMPTRPAMTTPVWVARQLSVPAIGLTCSLQRQPGWAVMRPKVTPPRVTISTVPLGKVRVSSGVSMLLPRRPLDSVVMFSSFCRRGGLIHMSVLRRLPLLQDEDLAHGVLAEGTAAAGPLGQELAAVGQGAVGHAVEVVDQAEEDLGRRQEVAVHLTAEACPPRGVRDERGCVRRLALVG